MTCSPRLLHLLSEQQILEFRFMAFSARVPLWASLFPFGSLCVAGGYGKHILCATSSHFASAEKEFRFPLGYGNQRPLSATWTVTGSGACVLGYEPPSRSAAKNSNSLRHQNTCAVITGITTGRLVDFGLRIPLTWADAWLLPRAIP